MPVAESEGELVTDANGGIGNEREEGRTKAVMAESARLAEADGVLADMGIGVLEGGEEDFLTYPEPVEAVEGAEGLNAGFGGGGVGEEVF